MPMDTGLVISTNYAGAATNAARIDLLLAKLPNPDAPAGTGPAAANGDRAGHSYLDEISPMACAEIRAELKALKAALT